MKESSITALQSSLTSKERKKHHTSFIGLGVKLAITENIFSASNPCEGLGSKCLLSTFENEENCFVLFFLLNFTVFESTNHIVLDKNTNVANKGKIHRIKK